MPFTLAHPAAILPFRRFCPRFFSFPALVAGSLSPDVGYCFGTLNVDDFSHSLNGSIEFCLPVGVVMLGLYYGLRLPLIEMLPERHRKTFLPFCGRPIGSPLIVIVSLLIGIWIHLLLDSLTHKNGWLKISRCCRRPCFQWERTLSEPLICSGMPFPLPGLSGSIWQWEQWRNNLAAAATQATGRVKSLGKAVLAAILMVPIELTHHLIPGLAGLLLIAGYTVLILIAAVLRMGNKSLANH